MATCPTVTNGTVVPAPSPGVDWSGCDLRSASLYNADLTGANLVGADLSNAYMRGTKLASADVSDANFNNAFLWGSDVTGAHLAGAQMKDMTGWVIYPYDLSLSVGWAYVIGVPADYPTGWNGCDYTQSRPAGNNPSQHAAPAGAWFLHCLDSKPLGVTIATRSATSVAVTWNAPFSGGTTVTGYKFRLSKDLNSWTTPASTGSSSPGETLTMPFATARYFEAAGVNSGGLGPWSDPFPISTKGTTSAHLIIKDQRGLPVSGGAVTWAASSGSASSSVPFGLTADGVVDFPAVAAGGVTVSLKDGQTADGTYVTGSWDTLLGADTSTRQMVVPASPGSSTYRVHVTLPGGLPASNVSVAVDGLLASKTSDGFTFRPGDASTAGTTDQTGLYVASGYPKAALSASIRYDDGVILQTQTVPVTGPDTNVELDYAPFVTFSATSTTSSVNAAVNLTLVASQLTAPASLSLTTTPDVARRPQPGVRVTLVPPIGARTGSCGARFTGYTNAAGKVALRLCATKSGVVRVRAAGAVPIGAFTLLVRGTPPLQVRSVTVKSPNPGTASISWARPYFTGGVPVVRYRVTVAARGIPTRMKAISVASASTPLRTAFGGLLRARRYSVQIVAINRYGTSDPFITSVAVA